MSFDSGGLVWSPRVYMSEKSSGGGSSWNISSVWKSSLSFFPPLCLRQVQHATARQESKVESEVSGIFKN